MNERHYSKKLKLVLKKVEIPPPLCFVASIPICCAVSRDGKRESFLLVNRALILEKLASCYAAIKSLPINLLSNKWATPSTEQHREWDEMTLGQKNIGLPSYIYLHIYGVRLWHMSAPFQSQTGCLSVCLSAML